MPAAIAATTARAWRSMTDLVDSADRFCAGALTHYVAERLEDAFQPGPAARALGWLAAAGEVGRAVPEATIEARYRTPALAARLIIAEWLVERHGRTVPDAARLADIVGGPSRPQSLDDLRIRPFLLGWGGGGWRAAQFHLLDRLTEYVGHPAEVRRSHTLLTGLVTAVRLGERAVSPPWAPEPLSGVAGAGALEVAAVELALSGKAILPRLFIFETPRGPDRVRAACLAVEARARQGRLGGCVLAAAGATAAATFAAWVSTLRNTDGGACAPTVLDPGAGPAGALVPFPVISPAQLRHSATTTPDVPLWRLALAGKALVVDGLFPGIEPVLRWAGAHETTVVLLADALSGSERGSLVAAYRPRIAEEVLAEIAALDGFPLLLTVCEGVLGSRALGVSPAL